MDLTLDDDQQAIADLAARILREKLPAERLAAIEERGDWHDPETWRALAAAGLLGAPLRADVGGGGFDFSTAALIGEQIGRSVAPLPWLATVVLAALPIDEFGSPEQRQGHLPRVVDGSLILTAALCEAGEATVPALPATRAARDGAGWRIDGEKVLVPATRLAARMLVPARTGAGTSTVFLVDREAAGVTTEAVELTSFEPQAIVRFAGVRVPAADVLGPVDGGGAVTDWIAARATTALCAIQAGVCEEATRLTARHVSEREQFGQKIGMFQAVAHRAADAYIDTQAVLLTARQAAWRLAAGRPAADAIAGAKYWAAEGGQRVVHAAQHLHGGIGVDTGYPLHRYFRWAKQLELTLGGANVHLLRLGRSLAKAAGATLAG